MIAAFWHDIRHGVRMLIKNPGFAVIAIASIGVGVGANAAMFSLADGLIFRPLGVPRAGEVLSIVGTSREQGFLPPGLSYPDYQELRGRVRTFESLAAYRNVLSAFDARPAQPGLRTIGTAVSGNLFEAMRIRPALGRFFRPDEDLVPGRDAVVVLDYRTWRDRFGADAAILGRRVRITNSDFTVIGVSEESFKGLDVDVWPTFYIPLAMLREVTQPPSEELTRREVRGVDVKGRLIEGATLAQARAEIMRIGDDLAKEFPDTNRSQGLTVRTELDLRMGSSDAMLILMLMALAGAVLLVACANVAGLLVSRAPARAREVALRVAMGAGRFRMVRQLVTESLILAAGGAALGLAIAYGGIVLLRQIEFPTEVPLKLFFELDRRVLILGLVIAVASAVLSSLFPAWKASRQDLVTTIKDSPRSRVRTRQWGRESLVCLQVALSLILVTVTAGLYSGFNATIAQGPGYRTEGMLLMRFDPRLAGYDDARARQFYTLLKETAQALSGVTSVTLTSLVPMKTDTLEARRVAPEGVRLPDGAPDVRVLSSRVDEDFFTTLAIPIIAGRSFTRADRADTRGVAVVNQTFAERYWPGQTAVGKRVRVRPFDQRNNGWFEIVGVAATTKYTWMGESPQGIVYLPRTQIDLIDRDHTLVVATADRPQTLLPAVRDAVRAIDPNMPMFGIRTMEDLYESRGVKVPSIVLSTVGGMSGMGLLLALVGLYGLVAYGVNRRTREIGVRIAVGATPSSILRTVLRRGFVLTLVGLAVGALGSAASGRALEGAIPGIGDFGPATYAVVVPMLFAVTLFAAYVPARRAARIDPVRALRTE
jgi:predicted permease